MVDDKEGGIQDGSKLCTCMLEKGAVPLKRGVWRKGMKRRCVKEDNFTFRGIVVPALVHS